MPKKNKHLILSNGESYVEPITKKSGGGDKLFPHSYEESKIRLLSDLDNIQNIIKGNKETFIKNTNVICVRLEPNFEAKSYQPNALIANTNIKLIGGRKYNLKNTRESNPTEKQEKSKLYFLKISNKELSELKENFSGNDKDSNKSWCKEICSIKKIDLLEPKEKVMGFSNNWEKGPVEIILHPLEDAADDAIKGFFTLTNIDEKNAMIRTYENGLTFISLGADKTIIDKLKSYNPLRSIKPIGKLRFGPLRSVSVMQKAPPLSNKIYKSQIKIGVFDGGIDKDNLLLQNYVSAHDSVVTDPDSNSLEHGTSVCGAVLFGDMREQVINKQLNEPVVYVESFRVFPACKTGDQEQDYEMYTTIDIIEDVVRNNNDINVFNISFGPQGPIVDDDLNRFTYALDKLTYDVPSEKPNPLFCIAAGNDGACISPGNRIQSPSDMVNGLAVGSYVNSNLDEKKRAEYSCVGPGREGAKIKPDILEFGGDRNNPFVCVARGENNIGISAGTSLSAPVVAGKIGILLSESEQILPHMARTLLIHSAEINENDNVNDVGFGYVPKQVTEILNCEDNKVTTLYSGEFSASTSVRLPIFIPHVSDMEGLVSLKWTISTVVNPNINDADAYTNNCIEDTFYPHNMKFKFTKKNAQRKILNLANPENAEKAAILIDHGYKVSDLPVSAPAQKARSETSLRNNDFKWDTIIKKQKSMYASSLLGPFLVLHAIGRNEYEHEKVRYYVAITVDAPKYPGSLYDITLQEYSNLIPIKVRSSSQARIPN